MFIDLLKLCCNIHLFSWDLMKGDHDNTICVSGWEGYAKVININSLVTRKTEAFWKTSDNKTD